MVGDSEDSGRSLPLGGSPSVVSLSPTVPIPMAHKLNNEKIREITKSNEVKLFCDMQHLKYIAHVTRLDNNSLQAVSFL